MLTSKETGYVMIQKIVSFDKRLKPIVRRHSNMSNGVVRSINAQGLIVARPRLYKPSFPLKSLLIVLTFGFLLKGFLLAGLGEVAYAERVAEMQTGSMIEQIGAGVMRSDPLTVVISNGIATILP
ncbi:MAG: hypothetical protein ACJAZ1_001451 [Yoonia sp.]|jgi:hypothetical protein